jgi:diaminopropionate ammonia-lyase
MRLFRNPRKLPAEAPYGKPQADVLNEAGFAAAFAEITSWPGYEPTPLVALPGLAARLGLGAVWLKDESKRFTLKSFKALGGAYAVGRAVQAAGGAITVTCATDGNHGRSVAWGAKLFGARAVIFMHEGVSEGRARAIASFGAEIRRAGANYDESVRAADAAAKANGWTVVSDTSYEGYTEIPRDVMHGYGVMADEVIAQLRGQIPTHVLVHAGVGGWAAALCARFWQVWGAKRPRFILVEPEKADCCYRSALAGKLTTASGDLDTVMAGLACGEASPIAWTILDAGVDDFTSIADEYALRAMRVLAEPQGDPALVAGETGAASLGALVAAQEGRHYAALGLSPSSRVLIFSSEGDTDPEIYRRIVGQSAAEVVAG